MLISGQLKAIFALTDSFFILFFPFFGDSKGIVLAGITG
jgi:hypothetical protein